MKQLYITILLFLIAIPVSAEKLVKGRVLNEQEEPIVGANIYWEGTQQGTTSDADGYFELKGNGNAKNLVVSYIGYTASVVPVGDKQAFARRVGWRSRFAGSRDQRA